ncbi:MAG: chemotaxis protein CheB, partial [Saprospiraceae bacterium]|nr:chemotaxis protein CheB [Saprospiraceae bacterium]
MEYEAIVIGVSSGGMNALKYLFSTLPADYRIPIIIVQHVSARSDNDWIKLLNAKSNLSIKEAD